MARADGVVAKSEIEAFSRIVIVPAKDRGAVERLFRLAQKTTDGAEAYAAQLARTFPDKPTLIDDVIDGLFLIAKADGSIHEAELAYLRRIVRVLGRTEDWFETVLARHVELLDDPYRVLGLDRALGMEAMRSHYRKLVSEAHPDRSIAGGLPPEAIRIATDRMATINAAWSRIEDERRTG